MVNVSSYQKQDLPLETADDSYPVFVPSIAVMISCADARGRVNITPVVAWTVVARYPFTVAIGLCNGHYSENYFPRHSRKIIRQTREFVLNIPDASLCEAVTKAGSVSGAQGGIDKFALTGLTPGPARTVRAPIIQECPINLECKVTRIVRVGSHDVFFAEVTAIQCDPVFDRIIETNVMVLDVLRPNPATGELERSRLNWRTLPEFVTPCS